MSAGDGVGAGQLVRALRKRCAFAAHVPGDELAEDRSPVPFSRRLAELFPQVVLDPDGPVGRVGLFHADIVTRGYALAGQVGLPCISTEGTVSDVRVYIHDDNDSTAQTEVSGAVKRWDRTLPMRWISAYKNSVAVTA